MFAVSVHLWQRIRNTKELVVELKRADAALQRKIASGAVASWTIGVFFMVVSNGKPMILSEKAG